jgi:hypothetical protein
LEILRGVLGYILRLSTNKSVILPIEENEVCSLGKGTIFSDREYSDFCTVRDNITDYF